MVPPPALTHCLTRLQHVHAGMSARARAGVRPAARGRPCAGSAASRRCDCGGSRADGEQIKHKHSSPCLAAFKLQGTRWPPVPSWPLSKPHWAAQACCSSAPSPRSNTPSLHQPTKHQLPPPAQPDGSRLSTQSGSQRLGSKQGYPPSTRPAVAAAAAFAALAAIERAQGAGAQGSTQQGGRGGEGGEGGRGGEAGSRAPPQRARGAAMGWERGAVAEAAAGREAD